jgi:hypothetical protein
MSFDVDFDAQLVELRERSARMDDICREVGRDPATLRRSVNLFDADARAGGGAIRYYADESLFRRLVTELVDAGYTDIGMYYPSDPAQVAAFEAIGNNVVPELRALTS